MRASGPQKVGGIPELKGSWRWRFRRLWIAGVALMRDKDAGGSALCAVVTHHQPFYGYNGRQLTALSLWRSWTIAAPSRSRGVVDLGLARGKRHVHFAHGKDSPRLAVQI